MQQMPKTVPISDIKNRPSDVMELMGDGPVMLTVRGNAAGVLISVDEWNEMVAHMKKHKFTKAHMDALANYYIHKDEPKEWVDSEDLRAMMAERNGHVASPV